MLTRDLFAVANLVVCVALFLCVRLCPVSSLIRLGCQYQRKRLTGKNHFRNDSQYVCGDVKSHSLTQLTVRLIITH